MAPSELTGCPYREPNWKLLYELAVLAHEHNLSPEDLGLSEFLEPFSLSVDDVDWLESVWHYPIDWTEGSNEFHHGRHRVCGMKVTRVTMTLVTDGELGVVGTEWE